MHPKFIPNELGQFPGRNTMNRRIRVIDPLPPAVRTTRGKATPIQLAAFLCEPIFFRHIYHVNALRDFEPLELDAVAADMGKLILEARFVRRTRRCDVFGAWTSSLVPRRRDGPQSARPVAVSIQVCGNPSVGRSCSAGSGGVFRSPAGMLCSGQVYFEA
jgi:hypothetical protein